MATRGKAAVIPTETLIEFALSAPATAVPSCARSPPCPVEGRGRPSPRVRPSPLAPVFACPDARCWFVPNGIDKSLFTPRDAADAPGGPLRILIEGQHTLWFKGVDEALDVVSRMRERGYSLDEIRQAVREGRLATGYVEDLLPDAKREPYADRPGHHGWPTPSDDDTASHMENAHLQGLQVCVHAMGDAGRC